MLKPLFLKSLLVGSTLSLAVTAALLAEPVVITMKPPKGGYTEEDPSYVHLKEVKATRVSSREVDFEVTLQGEVPKNLPRDKGLAFIVFVDGGPYEFVTNYIVSSTGKMAVDDKLFRGYRRANKDFDSDAHVLTYQLPNSSAAFKTWAPDSFQQDRSVWKIDMTSARVQKDKVTFSVQSGMFAELKIGGQPANVRLIVAIDELRIVDRDGTSGKKTVGHPTSETKPFPLPTKDTAATPTPTPSIFDRPAAGATPAATP